jgi:multiple sugar transport system substrate-binding protein
VFMRNWPYAWAEAEAEGSPVKGRVDFTTLPTVDGRPGAGTLGGWQLAVNAKSSVRRRDAAVALIRFLTSADSMRALQAAYGRNPPRRSLYKDDRLRDAFLHARPRPVTPYYGMLSDALQSEFSAAISGIRAPAEALRRAQAQADRITGAR